MKKLNYILIVLVFLTSHLLFGQDLYFTQYDNSSKSYYIINYYNGRVKKKEIMVGFNFQVSPSSVIFHSNLTDILTYKFSDNDSKLYFKPSIDNSRNNPESEEYILSFDLSPNENIYYEVGSETYRLEKNRCKLFKWSNGKEQQLNLPHRMNFINFDISPDERKIAFIHTVETENTNLYYLMLYDFETTKLDTIDNDYDFGYFINRQVTRWANNNLFYVKDGHIYEHNLKTKDNRKIEIPFEGKIKDFEIIGSDCYFIDSDGLYVWNNKEVTELFKTDKFDYLVCLRQKQNDL